MLLHIDAKKTQLWLQQNVPKFYDKNSWPAKSPDLNPIENLWSIMEEKIKRENLNTKKKLKAAIKKVWNDISLDEINTLINSMSNKIAALKKAKGGHTKY